MRQEDGWSIQVGFGYHFHWALFVRDALKLDALPKWTLEEVTSLQDVVNGVPLRVATGERERLTDDWGAWWRALLDWEPPHHFDALHPDLERLTPPGMDAPIFESLSCHPRLRSFSELSWHSFLLWWSEEGGAYERLRATFHDRSAWSHLREAVARRQCVPHPTARLDLLYLSDPVLETTASGSILLSHHLCDDERALDEVVGLVCSEGDPGSG